MPPIRPFHSYCARGLSQRELVATIAANNIATAFIKSVESPAVSHSTFDRQEIQANQIGGSVTRLHIRNSPSTP